MSEDRRHIFLVPLKTINDDFLEEIRLLDSYKSEQFSFLLSIQDHNSYIKAISSDGFSKSVIFIRPDKYYDRTQHWEYIVKYAHANLYFDSFSFYFFGDTIRLCSFPVLHSTSHIFINDYYVDDWDNLKENITQAKVLKDYLGNIIRRNFILGRPLLAPLQKIIFTRNVAPQIIFDDQNPYVSDQLMLYDLIMNGNCVEFIKKPFYKINNRNRTYSGTIGIIKQQVYLYIKVRCFIGIPVIITRTLIKKFLKQLSKCDYEKINY